MPLASLLQLLLLAAIWGSSFLFMRVTVPLLGPAWLIEFRVLLGAVFLWAVARWLRQPLAWRGQGRHYALLGLFNTALPFLLFAYAARTLPASLLSILNATGPIWGALIAAVWQRTPLRPRAALGMVLGVAGVVLLLGLDAAALQSGAGWAIAATLGATCCYGLASNYARVAPTQGPLANAQGSMWAAVLWVLPLLPWLPAPATPGPTALAMVAALGLLCTGVAYLLYFRLVADIGAAPALTVGFLIPLFGVLWGWLFLGEAVGWHTLAGGLVVLVGTALVTGFDPRTLWARKEPAHG
uniref:DMT family transporter n=1 Tax=Hylemonella sp. TaxID=2066020 RepID=UPI0035B12758